MRRIVFPAVVLPAVMLMACLWPAVALAQPKEPPAPAEQVVLSGDVVVPKGRVAGQVVVITGSATVLGVVDGDVVVFDGPIAIQGQVSGDVVALDGSVKLAATAQVTGSVLAGEDVVVAEGAQIGGVSRDHVRLTLGAPLAALGVLLPSVAIAVSVLLAALVLLVLAPRGGDRAASALASAPVASTGWGLLFAIVVPVLGVAAAASVVGLPFGLALLLGTGLLWLLGQAAAIWAIGRLIVREPRSRLGAVLVGWLIGTVIGLVPYLNVVWWVLGSVVGLGAAIVAAWRARRGPVGAPTSRAERGQTKGGRHAAGRVTVVIPPAEADAPPAVAAEASWELPATPPAED